jgi:hypothetical protein
MRIENRTSCNPELFPSLLATVMMHFGKEVHIDVTTNLSAIILVEWLKGCRFRFEIWGRFGGYGRNNAVDHLVAIVKYAYLDTEVGMAEYVGRVSFYYEGEQRSLTDPPLVPIIGTPLSAQYMREQNATNQAELAVALT